MYTLLHYIYWTGVYRSNGEVTLESLNSSFFTFRAGNTKIWQVFFFNNEMEKISFLEYNRLYTILQKRNGTTIRIYRYTLFL